MKIKKSSLILFSLVICHVNNYGIFHSKDGHETKKSPSQCTGKVAKKRPELFVQAEKYEQEFTHARTQCLQDNDCDTNPAFKQAQDDVSRCIVALRNHLEELKKGKSDACNVCEKTETEDIYNRLTELVKSN